jgi:2-oxoglutarate dehydrogenase E2 component (dihydrolipoamide succinyltransferase)
MKPFEIKMPKLGESIQEATITRWFVKEGDLVAEDTVLLEVATDKVDSEIPSPVDGTVIRILAPEGSLLPVGEVIALISLTGEDEISDKTDIPPAKTFPSQESSVGTTKEFREFTSRFYSPLVKQIAKKENIGFSELESISGSGTGGRVQKKDILEYISLRKTGLKKEEPEMAASGQVIPLPKAKPSVQVTISAEDQIIEMDRVRKLIARNMMNSKQTSPHVTSVVEADVTNLVQWRNKIKDGFLSKYGEKLTYMPLFMEAVTKALTEFPWLNASVDEDRIILHKHINLGIAVAKPDGNLIVPVVKNAEEKNLPGLVRSLNSLADAARKNKLSPDDIREGTFSITNFGSFRNLIGTPIINQPEVAILATGSIEKKPAVLELPSGDVIAIRHKMFLSLSYDHRIIDGAMGGAFLRRIADLLEDFDIHRNV